jgi:LCP family protein required for cell wall assembly
VRRRPARSLEPSRSHGCAAGCLPALGAAACLILAGLAYLLFPLRTNILLLGIDRAPPRTVVGRSDTIIMLTFTPVQPYVGMLSIPRDLWVEIPGQGQNRINTAHFFAEGQQAGAGPKAAAETIAVNFGIRSEYFVRIKFAGFKRVVDALGGVELDLSEPIGGYPAGVHALDGSKALGFVRRRAGADDFFRMEQGQILMRAIYKKMLQPAAWPRLPQTLGVLAEVTDTNIPVWVWPRLGLALLRAGLDGIESRVIEREMVIPFTTEDGAAVLQPDWALINPLVESMFGPR